MECKYCKDEFCVNDSCPMRGDYCPVVDFPGVCKYETFEPLERFVKAQMGSYEVALREIQAGRKLTHWMWWIFPQYKGIGVSETSKYYAIQSRAEAQLYWEHPILGARLRECMRALLDLKTNDAIEVFGEIDAQKLKSCMTLFYLCGGQALCGEVLDKFFPRQLDPITIGHLLKERGVIRNDRTRANVTCLHSSKDK